MSVEVGAALIFKFLGAAAGTVLALVFVPPRTLKGFFRRGAAALISGPIFAPYVQGWVGFAPDVDGLISAACLAAFVSWWFLGTIIRIAQSSWLSDRVEKFGRENDP